MILVLGLILIYLLLLDFNYSLESFNIDVVLFYKNDKLNPNFCDNNELSFSDAESTSVYSVLPKFIYAFIPK